MKQVDVLIIDDEVKFAGMLSKRLEIRGISSDVCYDGMSGLAWIKAKSHSVTLILLDLKLPDIYGTQVLAEIKQVNPKVPVVIVTGHGSADDKDACMKLGAVEFVNKPIRIDTIVEWLNAIERGDLNAV